MFQRNFSPGIAHVSFVLALVLSLPAVEFANAQVTESTDTEATVGMQGGRYGVGFASSWPAYGISGTMQFTDAITAEAVLGVFGAVSNFGGRLWYRFKRDPSYDIYGYGALSVYRYGYTNFDRRLGRYFDDTESVLGIGGGVGIEWGLGNLFDDPDFPPLFVNGEIGLAMASFDYYDFSSFVFGAGIHYRFGK